MSRNNKTANDTLLLWRQVGNLSVCIYNDVANSWMVQGDANAC